MRSPRWLLRNPAKQWIDRKVVGPPLHWLAWRFCWPERLRDRMLGWYYTHCAEGRIPTKRQSAQFREFWKQQRKEAS